jgi:3-hydroxybutyryl-CoA dehydrogenase
MITTGGKIGPFGMMDMVGMETIYNIESHWGELLKDKATLARAAYYKKHYIDTGKLGIKTKEGFYKYPNPKFQDPDFLK